VWAIVEALTFALNPIVSTCVLNQLGGHWLLSNALTIIIILTMTMEVKLLQLFNVSKVSNLFEAKILFLHKNMQLEVIKVINPFFDFLKSFDMQ
jgi:hypothetical protein